MNKGENKTEATSHCPRQEHSEESTTATPHRRTHAHTHTQTKSGVRYTGLYTGGVILQKLEGKVGKDGVLERALASQ